MIWTGLGGEAQAAGPQGVDGFTPQHQTHRRSNKEKKGLFGRKSTTSPGGNPNGSDGSDGIPSSPESESVEQTEARLEPINQQIRTLEDQSESESESDDGCRARSIDTNSPHFSETITFFDGYKAESVNLAIDHQLVKHGHSWGIDDIDLKTTEDANKPSVVGQFEQIRTRLTPANRNQFRINLREFASRPNLEVYSNYPINKGIGRAYLDPKTNLFVDIDENGIIRKAYPASEGLINFLRTNCDGENSGNE